MRWIGKIGLSFILMLSMNFAMACNDGSPVHNDILRCLIEEFQPVDAQLNQLYQQKIAALSAKDKTILRQSQRKWVAKKERTCIVDDKKYGRESHFDAMQCQIDMTKARISILRK